MKLFNYKTKRRIERESQKAQIAKIEVGIGQQNELYRALYDMLSSGMALTSD